MNFEDGNEATGWIRCRFILRKIAYISKTDVKNSVLYIYIFKLSNNLTI